MTFGKIGARPLVKSWTARDYVQNGLVAMWDGIENAGWGVHDPNATTWKDLSANGWNWSLVSGNYTWHDTHIAGVSRSSGRMGDFYGSLGDVKTVELVADFTGPSAYGRNGGIVMECSISDGVLTLYPDWRQVDEVVQFLSGRHKAYFVYGSPLINKTCYYGATINESDVNECFFNGEATIPYIYQNVWVASSRPCLGAYRIGDERYPFLGTINAIRLYSRALTADEIAANYAVDKLRFNLPTT